jgi:hypothetical protein
VIINIGKIYTWTFDDEFKKIEFLFNIVTLFSKHLHKSPRLINLDEELLKDQMELYNAQQQQKSKVNAVNNTVQPNAGTVRNNEENDKTSPITAKQEEEEQDATAQSEQGQINCPYIYFSYVNL